MKALVNMLHLQYVNNFTVSLTISGVTKTRDGKRNGLENGMKRKICNAIYVYLRKTYIHYLCMNHLSFPLKT